MDDLLQLVRRNYLRNRTIVSRDIEPMLRDVADTAGLELTLHRFPTGAEHGTWIVPESWDVREAWLKAPDGTTIASYADHPLFVAPYSMPFRGRLRLDELTQHVRCHPTQDDAFYYEHRLAYDYQRRLKEWTITLPRRVLESLPKGEYDVCIDVEVRPGEMLVGELRLPGTGPESVALLTDYCHPGQVNDSLSGLVASLDALRRLALLPERRHTYRLFMLPETIGSCILLAAKPEIAANCMLAVFTEFVGWGQDWVTGVCAPEGSLAWKLARESLAHQPDMRLLGPFDDFYRNDEMVFQYAGVPSLALQKTNCEEYHSSNDSPDKLRQDDLRLAADTLYRYCDILEKDRIYHRVHNVPPYLTRFQLYENPRKHPEAYAQIQKILFALDGRKSLLDIAASTGVSFERVSEFCEKLASLNIIQEHPEQTA